MFFFLPRSGQLQMSISQQTRSESFLLLKEKMAKKRRPIRLDVTVTNVKLK